MCHLLSGVFTVTTHSWSEHRSVTSTHKHLCFRIYHTAPHYCVGSWSSSLLTSALEESTYMNRVVFYQITLQSSISIMSLLHIQKGAGEFRWGMMGDAQQRS